MFLETQIVQDKCLIIKYLSQEHQHAERIQKAVSRHRKKEKSIYTLPNDMFLLVKHTAPFTFATLYTDELNNETAEILLENLENKFAEMLEKRKTSLTPEDKEILYDYLEQLTFYCIGNSLKGSLKEENLFKSEYEIIDIEDDSSTERSFTSNQPMLRKKRSPLLDRKRVTARLMAQNANSNEARPRWNQIFVMTIGVSLLLGCILLIYIQGGY